jgi:hypothetical protein
MQKVQHKIFIVNSVILLSLPLHASQVLFSFRLECNKSRRKRLDGLSKGELLASHIMVTVSLKVKMLTV